MYSPEDVILPDNFLTGIENKPELLYKTHYYTQGVDLPVGEWKRLIAYYWGFCTLIDDQVGEIINYLKEKNLYDNTVICFTTDHGDMMGSHGLVEKGYPMQYEEINKIPLVIRVPGRDGQEITNDMVSMTDILPIVSELAGAPLDISGTDAVPPGKREYLISESFLLDSVKGVKRGGIPKYAEDLTKGEDRVAIAVKDKEFKYVLHTGDIDELYDLTEDPGENINLAGDGNRGDIISHYKKIITEEIKNNPVFYDYMREYI